ncbi:hypothetical protein HC031_22575 [Planosporangium thailandense]|uniref:Uncharacterized protein n=1 Tax=Planosporangium thailandense TaxID=765197 RepID=A0ABX0Y298_9ACTN|nr:hypothetical protein [Planosporangium thailandense]NJC72482.1 hypothetical protein [Planosporangium thailandense]
MPEAHKLFRITACGLPGTPVMRPDRRALPLEAVVAGTVLGEAMFAALRRPAQEDASARWLVDGEPEAHPESGR